MTKKKLTPKKGTKKSGKKPAKGPLAVAAGLIGTPLPGNPKPPKPGKPGKKKPKGGAGMVGVAGLIGGGGPLPGNPKPLPGGPPAAAIAGLIGRPLPGNPKLIVIPPASFGGGPINSAAASFMGGAMNVVAGLGVAAGLGGLLAQRRGRLATFAQLAMNSAAGLGQMLGQASATASALIGQPLPGQPKLDSAIEILEGVGALIVDATQVDVAAWRAALGARVLENVLVPLDHPTDEQPGALAPWHLQHINIQAARNKNLTGKGMLVGVLDTGIDRNHPEFAGKKIHFAEFDGNGNLLSTTSRDAGTHGTHVSGIIAGANVGVAPAADLAVAAVLTYINPANGALSGYLAQILKGLNWLLTEPFTGDPATPGVDVVNASLGGVGYTDFYYDTLAQARLITGTVMAGAIGNSAPPINRHGSPGNYDIVVGVGAVNSQSQVAPFSDWGTVSQHNNLEKPDLCAPGVDVPSAVPGGGYHKMSGTSMATPVVAGTLALLLQQDPTLSLNAEGLITRLYSLVQPLSGTANKKRGGRGELDLTKI